MKVCKKVLLYLPYGKLFLTFVLFLSLSFNNKSISQGSWFWQNPLPTRSGLNDLIFIDSLTGYSVGINGTVLKTTNSGYNWSCFNYFKSIYLNSTYFFNSNTGFILSDDHSDPTDYYYSEIIYTTNGGLNWNLVHSVNSYKLNKIYFINQNTGYAISRNTYSIGNNILKTTNGGINWVTVIIPNAFDMKGISFYNNNVGVIAGSGGKIVKTTDGGNNWSQIKTGTEQFNDILYISMDTIFAIGNNGVFQKTMNGGTNWQSSIINPVKNLYNIKFLNSLTGYIAGDDIYKTTNRGLTWDSISTNIYAKKISFANNNLYYLLGTQKLGNSIYDSAGLIYRSINSGYNWTNIHSYKASNDLTGIYMFNENTGFCIGNRGTLLKTTNGSTWDSISFPYIGYINCIKFFDFNTGFIGCDSGVVYKTTNAGNNWILQSTGHTLKISSFSFPNSSTGFYSSWKSTGFPPTYSGKICKTTDSGNSWNQIYSNWGVTVVKLCFPDVNTGYACSPLIGIIKTTNSGNNWFTIVNPSTGISYEEIYFINTLLGFAVFNANNYYVNIYKTTNGGLNWTKVDSANGGMTSTYYTSGNMQFVNNSTGYFSQISFPDVGRSGNIIKTTNGGNNWFSLSNSDITSLIFGSGLTCIQFVNNNTGYVTGENGIILKTTNGGGNFHIGINKISKIIPIDILLSQNYPNPFNPTTNIKYQVASSKFIRLVVFNILGKEVAVLVNEKLKAGEYETTFDGSGLPSGVYFYSLYSDGVRTDTKKMLMIK
jgi:photosystem II stability/assembly factor-like uncharacterized protein